MDISLLQTTVDRASGAKAPDTSKVAEAAQQFEALLISQMLRSIRESEGMGASEGDAAGASAMGFAEEHMAQALASQGGLGLARLVVEGLQKAPANAGVGAKEPASAGTGVSSAPAG
jgi:peptidoglycan hydrolase FlgJ